MRNVSLKNIRVSGCNEPLLRVTDVRGTGLDLAEGSPKK
jgi:hypothetical protein